MEYINWYTEICQMNLEQDGRLQRLIQIQKRTRYYVLLHLYGRMPLREKYLVPGFKARFWRMVLGQ